MDIRKIKKLIEMLEESQLNEIEITEGEESIRLSRSGPVARYERTLDVLDFQVTLRRSLFRSGLEEKEPV